MGIFHRKGTGGFKGAENREPDIDVFDDAFVGAKAAQDGGGFRRGHERVGSWEMKNNTTQNPRGLDHVVHGDRLEGSDGLRSMADYGRKSDDGLGVVDPYGKGVEVLEGV